MRRPLQLAWCATIALMSAAAAFAAEPAHEQGRAPAHQAPARGEPYPGPRGYQRPTEPQGWDARPQQIDRGSYQHNYQAARSYKIGPYRRPPGWVARRWVYGQILPRAYWTASYFIADYWLFGLEVPPAGCEWVRDDTDALLVNTATGQILQVEYGVFS